MWELGARAAAGYSVPANRTVASLLAALLERPSGVDETLAERRCMP